MCDYRLSARVTLYFTRALGLLAILLLFCLPVLLKQYHLHFRPLPQALRTAILAGFYPSCAAVLPALWHMDQLLRNILQQQLFIMENVRHIRFVRWCCLAVSIICCIAAIGSPALLLLSLIMAFLFLVVTVVGQIVKAAVAIQEENDLTV